MKKVRNAVYNIIKPKGYEKLMILEYRTTKQIDSFAINGFEFSIRVDKKNEWVFICADCFMLDKIPLSIYKSLKQFNTDNFNNKPFYENLVAEYNEILMLHEN